MPWNTFSPKGEHYSAEAMGIRWLVRQLLSDIEKTIERV
jgi:hypothetical protein